MGKDKGTFPPDTQGDALSWFKMMHSSSNNGINANRCIEYRDNITSERNPLSEFRVPHKS